LQILLQKHGELEEEDKKKASGKSGDALIDTIAFLYVTFKSMRTNEIMEMLFSVNILESWNLFAWLKKK